MTSAPGTARQPVVVGFGGGLNSTGLIVGWHERGLSLDLVLFADTGGERPGTYRHVEAFSRWMEARGLPPVTVVRTARRDGTPVGTLEDECLRNGQLPSLAYGFKKCSEKFKVRAQDQYYRAWPVAQKVRAAGGRLLKLIGYDADERRRADKADTLCEPWIEKRYPLIEWRWGREECAEACARAGFSDVPKSSCFFCPASTVHEIRALRREHPDLFARALAMEANAAPKLDTVVGLGRRFAWSSLDRQRELPMFDPPEIACECVDG